jgi:type IV secretory pathway VirB10-like protein
MANVPLRKLNKRLIYVCLMATSAIAIPMIVLPIISLEKANGNAYPTHQMATQAYGSPNDAFAISGTERFPASYGELQGFEQELQQKKVPSPSDDQQLIQALERMESKNNGASIVNDKVVYQAHYDRDDPWQEAKKREQKQQAFDHYDAKRSDIIFIDHTGKNNNLKPGSKEDDDAMLSNVALAENQALAAMPNQDNVFFMNRARNSHHDQVGRVKEALPFMLSQGSLIPAILQSEIDTSLPGPILARVSQNIWDSKTGQALLIPQNSQLIGEYSSNVGHGQARAKIVWQRIIFPNQQSVNLGSMIGVDKRGTSGTSGSVDNHYDKVALGLLLTTALGAGVRMSQGKYDPNSASISQELGNSLAQETARLGNKITDKMLSIPPTIKVPMGQRLNVFVEQDLSLQPYKG